jgi:hypothetical protein
MPALPSVVNTVKATVHGTIGTAPYDNIFHLQYTGPAPTAADAITLATDVLNDYNTSFISLLGAGTVTTTGCDVVDLTSNTSSSGSASLITPGTRAGAANPNQVATVISWHINLRYRGGHPRTYLPGGMQADLQNTSHWTTSYLNAVNSGASSFRAAINAIAIGATTYKLAIVSYRSGGLARPTPFVLLVNSNAVHTRIDTQRRRLGKETL